MLRSTASGLVPVLVLALAACTHAPAEPDRPAGSSAPPPTVAPLVWDVPPTWTVLGTTTSGTKRAGYRVPKAGNDKEEAEMSVFFLGTGNKGDPTTIFKEWFAQFEGDPTGTLKREQLDAHGIPVETVEMAGTYKVPLGPTGGPNKRPTMQMVKKDFRLYGAVVKTPDRGNWFFKLTGPDETVQSAKSALRGMVESAR